MMNGSRLGLYNPIKEAYGGGRGGNEAGRVLTSVAAGATTGAIGGAVGSPLFLVKARMQNAGNKAGRYSYQYAGVIDGVRQILKQEGVRGLFRGVEGSILRVMVGSSAQLSSYDTCKRYVEWSGAISGGVASHLTASLMSGLVVTTAINPFDVVSTRLFSQQVKGSEGALYKSGIMGPFDCMAKMFKAEGFAGFYKGWTAQYLRLGPHTVLTFLFWEQAKIVYDKTVLL
jgi:solute carrier family 25 protein 34/35